jgi:Protein of unknown function (DUF3987)
MKKKINKEIAIEDRAVEQDEVEQCSGALATSQDDIGATDEDIVVSPDEPNTEIESFNEERNVGITPILEPKVLSELPALLQDPLSHVDDPRSKDVLLLGMLGVLSGCFPQISGRYANETYGPNLFLFVAAPAGGGKGILAHARKLAEPIDAELRCPSQIIGTTHIDNTEGPPTDVLSESSSASEAAIPKPRRLLHSGNSSASALLRNLSCNEGHGIIFETEGDTIVNSLLQDWGKIDDIFRKAFHHETISQDRVKEKDSARIPNPQLSVVISGTPNQLRRLIPDVENGLCSRFLFYAFAPGDPFEWKDIRPSYSRDTVHSSIVDGRKRVLEIYLELEKRIKPIQFRLTTKQWERLNEFGKCKKELLVKVLGTKAIGSSHRLTIHVFRLAMVLSILAYDESRRTKNSGESFASLERLTADATSFRTAIAIGSLFAEHLRIVLSALKGSSTVLSYGETSRAAFFLVLPETFTREEAVEVGEKHGFKKRSIDRWLQKLVEEGKLEKSGHGRYSKLT